MKGRPITQGTYEAFVQTIERLNPYSTTTYHDTGAVKVEYGYDDGHYLITATRHVHPDGTERSVVTTVRRCRDEVTTYASKLLDERGAYWYRAVTGRKG